MLYGSFSYRIPTRYIASTNISLKFSVSRRISDLQVSENEGKWVHIDHNAQTFEILSDVKIFAELRQYENIDDHAGMMKMKSLTTFRYHQRSS